MSYQAWRIVKRRKTMIRLPSPPHGKSLRDRLKWPVTLESISRGNTLYITTNPIKKTHKISIPIERLKRDPLRWLEVEHEYAHCLLGETIHPLLSTAHFAKGTDNNLMQAVGLLYRCACDWYADAVIYGLWLHEGRAEIEEHIRLLLNKSPKTKTPLPPEMTWGMGMIYAQLIHYGGHKRLIKSVRRMAPILDRIARIYLRYPPNRPTIEDLESLINATLKVATKGVITVSVIPDREVKGLDVLSIKQRGKA